MKSIEHQFVLKLVKEIRQQQPRIGTRKLYHMLYPQLKVHHIKLGRDALFDLLSRHGMLIRSRRRRAGTTNSNHSMKVYPNLIKELDIDASNRVWVSDITYIRTEKGFVYLFLITDAYSKKIVGYCVGSTLGAIHAKYALKTALKHEKVTKGLIHHSDRGIQYCSKVYVKVLRKNNIAISMTKAGAPEENAIAERINGILKQELLKDIKLYSLTHAREQIDQAIAIYNTKRPHSSCSMLTPEKAHASTTALKQLWKHYKKRKIKPNIVNQ